MSAAVADHFGLASNFFVFAGLNVAGAILVYMTIDRVPAIEAAEAQKQPASHVLAMHLGSSGLRAAFTIGFCILFALIGIFNYVNFVLVRPPIAIGMMTVGFVYFVFAPSFLTTPLAGKMAARFGTRPAVWGGLGLAAIGLPLDAGAEARSCDRRDDPGRVGPTSAMKNGATPKKTCLLMKIGVIDCRRSFTWRVRWGLRRRCCRSSWRGRTNR